MTNTKNGSNQGMVPEARAAMDRFKMEAAAEVGVNLKQGYNGDLTSRQAGSVGGQMVKKMCPVHTSASRGMPHGGQALCERSVYCRVDIEQYLCLSYSIFLSVQCQRQRQSFLIFPSHEIKNSAQLAFASLCAVVSADNYALLF